ncbi:MAG: hypothetical protein RL654_165 [Pseudomonadota bacterium]|jgi:hypothetical protein
MCAARTENRSVQRSTRAGLRQTTGSGLTFNLRRDCSGSKVLSIGPGGSTLDPEAAAATTY